MIKTSWDDDGRLYYYNSATRAAQWNKPRGYQIPIEVNANSPDTSRESYSADFGGWAQVIAKQPWVGYSDREGSPVWKNTETGVVTSRMPEAFREAMNVGVQHIRDRRGRRAPDPEEIMDLVEEELFESVLRLSLHEHRNHQAQGPAERKTTGKIQQGRPWGEDKVLAQKPATAVLAIAHNKNMSKCTGCFGKNAESQAPCGCKYCPDCLAGIFLQALEEEPSKPECCGRLLPMELAAPILQWIGIHPDTLDKRWKDGKGTEGVVRADDDKAKGKEMVGDSKDRAPVETMVDCLICMESMNPKDVIKTPCQHHYCHDCMRRLFVAATKNESLYPPKCCDKDIPLTVANTVLNAQQQTEFASKGAEFRTKDRLYCSTKHCSAFVPPGHIYDGVGWCGECRKITCVFCKGEYHGGDCPKDRDTHAVLKLARKSGWRKCFNCKYMVVLGDGCNHITCKCGAEFCYVCGAKWRTCECQLWRQENFERLRQEEPDWDLVY